MNRVPTGSIDYPYGFATALQGEVEWWLCIPKWVPPPTTTSDADSNYDGVQVTSVVAPASSENGGVWVDWLFPVTDTDGKFADANPDFNPLAGDRIFRSTNKFERFGEGSVRARIEAFFPGSKGTVQSTSDKVQVIVSAVPPQPSLRAILPPVDPDEDEPPLGCFFMPGVVLHYAHERKPRSNDPSSLEPLQEMCRHFYVKKEQLDKVNALYAKNYADVIVTKTMEGDVVILDAAEAAHHKKMGEQAAKKQEQETRRQEQEERRKSAQLVKKQLDQTATSRSSKIVSGGKRAREAHSSSEESSSEEEEDDDELDSDVPRNKHRSSAKGSLKQPKVKKEDTKDGLSKGRVSSRRESRKKELASVVMEGKDVLPPTQFIPVISPPDLSITKEAIQETARRIRVVERGERPNAVCLHECCLVTASTSLPSAAMPSTTLYLYIPYFFVGRIARVMMGNKTDLVRRVSVHAIEVVGKLLGASKIPQIVPILRAHESVHTKTQLPFLVPLKVEAMVGGSARMREGDFVGLGVDADAFTNLQYPTNPNKSNLQLDEYTRWACDKSLVIHRKPNSSSGRAFEVSTADLHVATERTVTPQRQVSAPAGMLQRLEAVLGRYKPQHAVPAENGTLDDSVSDEEESEDGGGSGSDSESDVVSTASSGITRAYRDLLAACQYAKDIQQYHPINHTTAATNESNDDSTE